jgi:hypothetical protein
MIICSMSAMNWAGDALAPAETRLARSSAAASLRRQLGTILHSIAAFSSQTMRWTLNSREQVTSDTYRREPARGSEAHCTAFQSPSHSSMTDAILFDSNFAFEVLNPTVNNAPKFHGRDNTENLRYFLKKVDLIKTLLSDQSIFGAPENAILRSDISGNGVSGDRPSRLSSRKL